MQQTCASCGSVTNSSSQFCTNCGAVLAPAQAYRQSWEAPPAQNPGPVPPWAQTPGGMYQQQFMNQNAGGSLGFGGQADEQAHHLLAPADGVRPGRAVPTAVALHHHVGGEQGDQSVDVAIGECG